MSYDLEGFRRREGEPVGILRPSLGPPSPPLESEDYELIELIDDILLIIFSSLLLSLLASSINSARA